MKVGLWASVYVKEMLWFQLPKGWMSYSSTSVYITEAAVLYFTNGSVLLIENNEIY